MENNYSITFLKFDVSMTSFLIKGISTKTRYFCWKSWIPTYFSSHSCSQCSSLRKPVRSSSVSWWSLFYVPCAFAAGLLVRFSVPVSYLLRFLCIYRGSPEPFLVLQFVRLLCESCNSSRFLILSSSCNKFLYYIHFEITGYPCNLIGSQQCDLFPNRAIYSQIVRFIPKSHYFLF